jgi:hypothetical protein
MPFKVLGLEEDCSSADVLRAWRRLTREHHTDMSGTEDDTRITALNDAKMQCLDAIIQRKTYTVSEQEFVSHICNILESKWFDSGLPLDLGNGFLIRPTLRKFFFIRTVDAMVWILRCVIGDMDFDQTKEDELPILCKFYNDFVGEGGWSEEDHTMMMVLNKYDQVKTGGYGNFARFREPS